MPAYKVRTVLEIARNLKAFLSLDAGVVRGEVPDHEGELARARSRIREQDRRLKEVRQRLDGRNRQLKQVRQKLARDRREGIEPRRHRDSLFATRKSIAFQYLTGSGIEIGALHQPLEVPPDVEVRYVDQVTRDELRERFPELAEHDLVQVDIVGDGETLSSVEDASVDFVIANHMLEHCQNIIATIENHLRVLKPDGIYFFAVPDKRYTFDIDRPLTPLEHMVRDYEEGALWSREAHYEEWARTVEKIPESGIAARVGQFTETGQDVHFHVWTQSEFLELLLYCQRELEFPFDIELVQKNHIEVVSVLRKHGED